MSACDDISMLINPIIVSQIKSQIKQKFNSNTEWDAIKNLDD